MSISMPSPVRGPLTRTSVSLVMLSALAASSSARSDEQLKQRFLTEGHKAWQTYRERGSLQGTVTYSVKDVSNAEVAKNAVKSTKSDFKFSGPNALAINHDGSETTAYGTNSRYDFQLKRVGDPGEWIIERLVLHDQENYHQDNNDELATQARNLARAVLAIAQVIYPRALYKMIEEPTFQLRQAEPVPRNGRQLVQIDYAYEPKDKKDIRIRTGSVLLDPEHSWVIREARAETIFPAGDTAMISVSVAYDDERSEMPIVKSYSMRSDAAGPVKPPQVASWTQVSEYEVSELAPSDKDFTLSAFGLAEPGGGPRSGLSWLWLLAAGVLLVGVAFVMKRFVNRRLRRGS